MKRSTNRLMALVGVLGVLATPESAIAADASHGPVPIEPGRWIDTSDYPPDALREDLEGSAKFEVSVNPDGTLASCRIIESSGVDSLDAATCAQVMLNAQFEPAVNDAGKPIAGTYRSTVVWKITPADMKAEPGQITLTLILEKDGSISDCSVVTEGAASRVDSEQACAQAPKFVPPTDAAGEPVRQRVKLINIMQVEDLT